MNTPRELNAELLRLSRSLDEAQRDLEHLVREHAEAENAYHRARASAYLQTPDGTVAEREARVDLATADERHAAHLAEGLSRAALESVRSRRVQLSSLQTLANSVREEAKLARYGPDAA